MISLTKIFNFEMAHAIHGYNGACKNIHGHSYELHVTVATSNIITDYIPAPGFIVDFKELKQLVNTGIIKKLDHKLVLSDAYLAVNPAIKTHENLVTWQVEPTAENLLIYMMKNLQQELPPSVKLEKLKLYETKDSFAEWTNDGH
jgi:6-pyruvoyltetrahydropterin/6-carboxytetrahydropterin synthase